MRELKDSGFDWIGTTPSDWQFIKGKYIFSQRNSKGNSICLQLLSPSQKFGVVPQTLLEELTTQNVVKVKEDTDLTTFKTIHAGDFCISLRSFQGGFEYCRYEGVVSSAYQVFYPTIEIDDGYYRFLFKDKSFIEKMNSYTISFRDGKNIAFSDFGNTYIPYPPLADQKKIAEFLDAKCSEIDALIADIQAQIETLEQYKRSTIEEAVTKGINSNAAMKDSGAGWLREIPSHWKIDKFKYRLTRSEPRNPGNMIVLSLYRELGIIPKDSRDDNHNQTSEDTSKYKHVKPGNFVVNKMKAWQGSVAVSDYEGIISPAYYVYKFGDDSFDKKYFHYLLRGCYKDEFMRLSGGMRVGQWDLSAEDLENTTVIIPPLEEQTAISMYLDKKCSDIDTCVETKKEQITTLEAYKKSIIFEYVTGKKEVE